MKTIKHFIAMLLCISLCLSLTQARPSPDKRQDAQATNTIAQDVLIIIQQEQVRFTAQKAVAEMQLQIFDQAGQMVYDSGAVTGPELTWVLRQANGETVKSGLYAYTLAVKEAGAADARVRRGHFIVDRAKERDGQTDRLWITSQNEGGVGTELTVARNEGVTIAGTSASIDQKNVRTAEGEARNGESESKNENNAEVAAAANGTTGRIAKFTSSTNLGDSVMTELNGNVGIETTNPISKFHIVSSASDPLPPRLQSSNTDTFAAGWDFYHGSTAVGYVGVPDGGTRIAPGEMLVYGVGTTSLWAGRQRSVTINSEGNVGIGTNPEILNRLYVVGGNLNAMGGYSTGGVGVHGTSSSNYGVAGSSAYSYGVSGSSFSGGGVVGSSNTSTGVRGISTSGNGVYGSSTYGYAGYFVGNVHVIGNLSKGGGSFKIDHPLDPTNKYLSHSFVESPDMMNIYNGNVTTDAKGQAVVTLPSYFTALNRDYRYQLTVVGKFAQAIVRRKIKDNRFVIKTDKPHVEVSWQVTGIRQDAYAEAHRIRVEEEKTGQERGTYLNPEAFGQPQEKGVTHARHSAATQQAEEEMGKGITAAKRIATGQR